MHSRDTEGREQRGSDARRAYEPPALTELGSLEELTGSFTNYGGGGGSELGPNRK